MQIEAAVLEAAGEPFVIKSLTLDPPQAGEVLVRIKAVGVCHSDWHLVTGATKHPLPLVPGHEGAGIVEQLGTGVDDLVVGDHVILNWAPACGECFYCRHSKPNLCDTYTQPIWAGTMLDGSTRLRDGDRAVYSYCGLAAFAERTVVLRQSCVKIRKEVPFDIAALVGCAVTTGVGAAMFTARVQKGQSVAIIGCGGVGLSCVQGAILCGAEKIIAIDLNSQRVAKAIELGATHGVESSPAAIEEVRDLTEGRGVDHAIEAVGIPALQEQAYAMTRPGGTVTFAGLSAMGTSTNLPGALIVREEKTIKGSYYGSANPQKDFPMLTDLYEAGKLDLKALVTRKYKLAEINEAYRHLLAGEGARGVIVMD